MKEIHTVYIVGPTASGKTALSIRVAKAIGAEIVCADSQTLRRGMDIGTAKPTLQEMGGIHHYMLDIINPYDEYSIHDFKITASEIINDIHNRNKIALIVGGSGLYVDSLYYDFVLPELDSMKSRTDYDEVSVEVLQAEIRGRNLVMPHNSSNRRHLINTLLRSSTPDKHSPKPDSLIVGIAPERTVLLERINLRVNQMFENGFVEEVRGLISRYGAPPRPIDGIGYRIVYRLINGEISEAEAKELIKIADRQYAKRQMSWFKRNPNIQWFDTPQTAEAYILETV